MPQVDVETLAKRSAAGARALEALNRLLPAEVESLVLAIVFEDSTVLTFTANRKPAAAPATGDIFEGAHNV